MLPGVLVALAAHAAKRYKSSMTTATRCLLDSGTWVDASIHGGVGNCCALCVSVPECTGFVYANDDCQLEPLMPRNNASLHGGAASYSRGVVLSITHLQSQAHNGPVPVPAVPPLAVVGRRLRHRRRRRPAVRLALSCISWAPFNNLTVAQKCAKSDHPHRFSLAVCANSDGQADTSGLAAAQASEFYTDCGSHCLYHPETPASAGWQYMHEQRCWRAWRSTPLELHHAPRTANGAGSSRAGLSAAAAPECLASLLGQPMELTRLLSRASRACPFHERCRLPRPLSTKLLHDSGMRPCTTSPPALSRVRGDIVSLALCAGCESKYSHRNSTSVCGAGVSIEVARAQINQLWDTCASRCLYSPITPSATGWRYETTGQCFRPFRLQRVASSAMSKSVDGSATRSSSSPQPHECLAPRRARSVLRVTQRASELCAECGEPQRYEVRWQCLDSIAGCSVVVMLFRPACACALLFYCRSRAPTLTRVWLPMSIRARRAMNLCATS